MEKYGVRPWGSPEERAKVPPAPPPPPPPPPKPPESRKLTAYEEQEREDNLMAALVTANVIPARKRVRHYRLVRIVPEMIGRILVDPNNEHGAAGMEWYRGDLLPCYYDHKVERYPGDGDYLVLTPKGKLFVASPSDVDDYFEELK